MYLQIDIAPAGADYFYYFHEKYLFMQRILSSLLFLLLFQSVGMAQPLANYVNMQNELMVWDRGMIHKIDFLPPTLIKTGRTAIPFLDNSRTFKIYYGGGLQQINAGFTNNFYVTDNLVGYLNQKALYVFDKGTAKNLTAICDQYFVADSLIFFLDAVKSDYKVYYNGTIQTVESFIPDSTLANIKVSDNIIAYNNFANQFRIFFHGLKIAQEEFQITSFKAGRNTVAYVDADRKFKIFHNGQTFLIDNFPPTSYHAGDDLVAFVSSDGYFKVFYGDSVRTLGYFKPTYQVADNIIAFQDPGGYMKVFYKGDVTDMESYYPTSLTIQYNSIAYVNTSGTLRLFSEGETYDVTNADLAAWQLNYDVITYQIGQGIFKVFYKGNEY